MSILILIPTLRTYVYAQELTNSTEVVLVEEFEQELAEENLTLIDSGVAIENSEEVYTFTIATETGEVVDLKLDINASTVVAEAESSDTGEIETYIFSLPEDVELTGEDISPEEFEDITIENETTGEIYEYEDIEGELSFALSIPYAIPIAWSALVSLYKVGLAIIVAGATYIAATHAISKINNNKNRKNHYLATLRNGTLYISKGVSEAQAVAQLRSGKSTWSTSRNQAKIIASKLAKGLPINEITRNSNGTPKKGYYWHWHSSTRQPKGHHAFYGYPI